MGVLTVSLIITTFLFLLIKVVGRVWLSFLEGDRVLYNFNKFRHYRKLGEIKRRQIQDLYTRLTPIVSEDSKKALIYFELFRKYFQGTISDNDFLLLYRMCCVYNKVSKNIRKN